MSRGRRNGKRRTSPPTNAVKNMTQITCECGTSSKATPANGGGFRTPKRWRKIDGGFRCPKCQAAQYMGRSIRLRITGPAEGEDRERKTMYEALNAASRQSNQFANWYMQQLLAADLLVAANLAGLEKTKDGKPKIPPLPKVDWYRRATALMPGCAPTSLCQQKQMIERYYGKELLRRIVEATPTRSQP